MMLGDAAVVFEVWPSTFIRVESVRSIAIIGAPQNRNVYCSFAEPRSKLGSKRLSSSVRIQPRLSTRNRSFPGRRIQRNRLCRPATRDSLSYWTRFAHDTSAEKL